MNEIRIDDPNNLGPGLTEYPLTKIIAKIFKFGSKVISPAEWLSLLADVVDEADSIKLPETLEGKAYYWIFNSLCKASERVMIEIVREKELKISGDLLSSQGDRFNGIFKETPLVLNYKFFDAPTESPFIQRYLKEFEKWTLETFKLTEQEALQKVDSLKDRFEEAYISELGKGDYKPVFDHVRHKMADLQKENLIRKNYREFLRSFYFRKVMNEDRMRLADAYIRPRFYLHAHCTPEKDPRRKNRIKTPDTEKETPLVDAGYPGDLHAFLGDFLKGENTLNVFCEEVPPKFLILLGHPGQGKTSFTHRFLRDYLSRAYETDKPIFYFRLRDLRDVDALFRNPMDRLKNHFMGSEELRQIAQYPLKAAEFFNAVWVLDGFDELAMKESVSEENIDSFCRDLAEISREKGGPHIILTSRLGYVNEKKLKWKDTMVLQLAEMSVEDQKTWLRIYQEFHIGEELSLTEANLEDLATGKTKGVERLVAQPILLHMVASSGIEINASSTRGEIYKTLFDKLIQKLVSRDWDKSGKTSGLENMTEKSLRRLLREIALCIFQSPNEYITKKEFLDHKASKKFRKLLEKRDLQDSLKHVLIAFYFQEVETGGNESAAFEFLHKSLQEYLTAEKIWSVFLELINKNREDEYIVSSGEKALAKLYQNLAVKSMSIEVRNFLIELMALEELAKVKEVYKRLKEFAPTFYDLQFLPKTSSSSNGKPLAQIANLGQCFLTVTGVAWELGFQNVEKEFPVIPSNILYCIFNNSPIRVFWPGGGGQMLIEAVLRGAYLRGADLSRADLRGAYLSGADLRGADLRGADLRGADLIGADLSRADLSGADLRGTDLIGAYLSGADLSRAYLSGAYLIGAHLSGAHLSGADLSGADLSGARSLYGVKGLPEELQRRLQEENSKLFNDPFAD